LDELAKALLAALAGSPLALVMGLGIRSLWNAKLAEQEKHALAIKTLTDIYSAEMKAERERCAAELRLERDRHQKEEDELRRELISAFKAVAGRGGSDVSTRES